MFYVNNVTNYFADMYNSPTLKLITYFLGDYLHLQFK